MFNPNTRYNLPTEMKKFLKYFIYVAVTVILYSCEKYEPPVTPDGPEPKLLAITFTQKDNPTLRGDVKAHINEMENAIDVVINYDINTNVLIPTVELEEGTKANISSGTHLAVDKKHVINVYNSRERRDYTIRFFINSDPSILSIKINGVGAYLDKNTNTYYAPLERDRWNTPVNVEVIAVGTDKISINGYASELKPLEVRKLTFRMGDKYAIKAEGGKGSVETNIIVSGLPIMSIECEKKNMNDLSGDYRVPCTLSLIDPHNKGERSHYGLTGKIKIRGKSSKEYDKKSMSLKLYHAASDSKINKKLLGMRSDQEWILDAMFGEMLRARNRVSHEVWSDMKNLHYAAKEPGALPTGRGEYIEMFYNGEYMGIYCLAEPTDRKQLSLSQSGGYLYKSEDNNLETHFQACRVPYVPPTSFNYFQGWESKYPNEYQDWEPLFALMRIAIDADYEKGAQSTFGKEITSLVDTEGMIDYLLFINLICGPDNLGRNTFLAIYDMNGPDTRDRKFFYIPWDMDYSFNAWWMYPKGEPSMFLGLEQRDLERVILYGNHLLMKMAKYDIDNFGDKVKKRWKDIRGGIGTEAEIMKKFDNYYNLLEKSGAYQREKDRWDDYFFEKFSRRMDPEGEMEDIKNWLPKNFSYLDNYINNWDENRKKITIEK